MSRMDQLSYISFILIFISTLGGILCIVTKTHFRRGQYFDGNICRAMDTIENTTSASNIMCMAVCSNEATCLGVFYEDDTQRCVLCTSKIFVQNTGADSKYYKREESGQGSTYLIVTDILSWEAAKINCENLGGHLLILSSEEENDWIIQYITTATSGTFQGILIGAKGIGGKALTFQWVDGTMVADGYSNWYMNQPGPILSAERYVFMNQNWNFHWNDDLGSSYSICEFE